MEIKTEKIRKRWKEFIKKLQNPRFIIMLEHKLKNKGKKLMVKVNLLFRPWR